MNLFVAWRDSLTILQPKNFKLFFLVTLKSMVDTFKVWIKYFWWLILIQWASPGLWFRFFGSSFLFFYAMWLNFFNLLFLVSILLAARPSVAIKNCAYFRSYIWRIIYILPVSIPMHIGADYLMHTMFRPYVSEATTLTLGLIATTLLIGILNWSVKVYIINYALFVLDTDGSIMQTLKSLLYAAKMIAYNYPFYIIVYFIDAVIRSADHLLWYNIATMGGAENMYAISSPIGFQALWYVRMFIYGLFTLFMYCLLVNFYIKKLHDQFTLYFGKNE